MVCLAGVAALEGLQLSVAGDLVLGTVEGREVGEGQGLPTVQLLAESRGLLETLLAVLALAVNRVPHATQVDLQLALTR